MLKKLLLAIITLSGTTMGCAATDEWKQFHDPASKFTVSYPANLTPSKNFALEMFTAGGWSNISDDSDEKQVEYITQFTLVYADVDDPDNGGSAYVHIYWQAALSRNPNDIANCYKPNSDKLSDDEENPTNVVFNGRTYKKFTYWDGGMMQGISVDIYRYQAKDACYDLELVKNFSNSNKIGKLLSSKDAVATKMFNSVKIDD